MRLKRETAQASRCGPTPDSMLLYVGPTSYSAHRDRAGGAGPAQAGCSGLRGRALLFPPITLRVSDALARGVRGNDGVY